MSAARNKHLKHTRTTRSRRPHAAEILPRLDHRPDPALVDTYERLVSAVLKKQAREHGEPVDGFQTMRLYSRVARSTYDDAAGLTPEIASAARLRALDGTGWPRARGAGSIQEEAREKRDLLEVPRPRAVKGERVRRGGKRR